MSIQVLHESNTSNPIFAYIPYTVAYGKVVMLKNNSFVIENSQVFINALVNSTNPTAHYVYNYGNNRFITEGAGLMDDALHRSIKTLDEIRELEDDWNGNGASRFPEALLNQMYSIVKRIHKQPQIFPTARDSIQFEYENDNGDYLEFELFDDGRIKQFLYTISGKSSTVYIDVEDINKVVDRFYERKF